ncbi:MAG: cytochrome c biogenesis protein CcsA [Thermoplasmatota archaeon]
MMLGELDFFMILIHPPLAILGYGFTIIAFFSALKLLKSKSKNRRKVKRNDLRISLTIAWILTFLGLVTGMIWAEIAWGSFWSWDPKETATLLLFIPLTLAYLANLKRMSIKLQTALLAVCLLMIAITVSVSFLDIGLHSFGH